MYHRGNVSQKYVRFRGDRFLCKHRVANTHSEGVILGIHPGQRLPFEFSLIWPCTCGTAGHAMRSTWNLGTFGTVYSQGCLGRSSRNIQDPGSSNLIWQTALRKRHAGTLADPGSSGTKGPHAQFHGSISSPCTIETLELFRCHFDMPF